MSYEISDNSVKSLGNDRAAIAEASDANTDPFTADRNDTYGETAYAFAPSSDSAPNELPKLNIEEQPKAPTELSREELEKFAAATLQDVTNGQWGDTSREGWQRTFEQLKSKPGATPENIITGLNQIGGAINSLLEQQGSPNRVGVGITREKESGNANIFMTISGPQSSEARVRQALATGQNGNIVVKAGTIRLRK